MTDKKSRGLSEQKVPIHGTPPKINELRQIRAGLGLTQADMASRMGVNAQSTYSGWESDPDKQTLEILKKAWAVWEELAGRPYPMRAPKEIAEPTPTYVTGVLPEHVQEAYDILLAAVDASGTDFKKLDRRRAGLVVGLIAEEVSKGLQAETRLTLIRRAEVLLGLKG